MMEKLENMRLKVMDIHKSTMPWIYKHFIKLIYEYNFLF